jgi:cytochrome b pre-mRNA-processing protein 3
MGISKRLQSLFGDDPMAAPAHAVYQGIVAQARQPAFYALHAVPDSLDGRFELLALHAFLVLRRLRRGGEQAAGLAQALVDGLILDMDHSLREMGAGDLGVGKRVKTMARGFYGRIAAYEAGLDGGDDMLGAALERNLYGTASAAPPTVAAMAAYMRREAAALQEQDLTDLVAGRVVFGPPPGPLGGDGT